MAFDVLGGLIGGAAQMAGNAMNNAAQMEMQSRAQTFEAQQAEQANAFTERMANSAQSFSERMSSTSHQREVADLKAAGLNPILSAGGGGASAPSGVGGSGQMAHAIIPRIGNLMEGVISTALQTGLVSEQSKKLEAEKELIQERRLSSYDNRIYRDESGNYHQIPREKHEAMLKKLKSETDAISANSKMQIELNKSIDEADPRLGAVLKLLQMFKPSTSLRLN